MEEKKFIQHLDEEDIIAFNSHLIDQKSKYSIMMPLLGLFMTGLGIYGLFNMQNTNEIVGNILYIILGLFMTFVLKRIISYFQKKSVRKQIEKNKNKVDMEVTVHEDGIRFEIIDDKKEDEKKEDELNDYELREKERYSDEVKEEEIKEDEIEEEEIVEEDYIPVELLENYGGVYEGLFDNDTYMLDLSKKGIYITINDNEKKLVEIISQEVEKGIKIKLNETNYTLYKKDIIDPNALLKLISEDESIYVNCAKVAEEGKKPVNEDEIKEEEPKPANALTIPWVAMASVLNVENYIFINMAGYESMIIKKSECDNINEVIDFVKEKLIDPKRYIDKTIVK